ncbi:Scr1 family TA system antitoxin-like transcriptional regulator [Streptomyces sp. NPDC056730]|uniref:helix-turn-helix domain-containing protein n=1 Tax=unclassified Streptomyces TaxID=2593676 RepID=UPI003678861D
MTERRDVDEPVRSPREAFGEALRNARELRAAGRLSQSALAKKARTSKSTISRIERGVPPIASNLPAVFDQIFETDGQFKRLYEEVVSRSFPALYRRRMSLEREAIAIWEWSPTIIPGLFQTAEYARALFRANNPRATEDEIAELMRARLARQELLRGDAPPNVRVVLCASVIGRRIVSRDAMREQLAVLLGQAERQTTRLQVLPLDAEPHLLIDGPITFLTAPNHVPVVCIDAFRTANIIEDPEHVRTAVRAYDDLTGEALSVRESAALIRKQVESL